MIATNSKNVSFICVQDVCDDQITGGLKCDSQVEQNVHSLKQYLRGLWVEIQLFFETDKWEHNVTLKVGDSHYTIKMEDIESRWRKHNSCQNR
jgi:hypothetical protein